MRAIQLFAWQTRQQSKVRAAIAPRPSRARSTDKQATTEARPPVASKGVILVSEAFTEINARLVIVLASGHRSPLQESDLVDPERDPDELAAVASKAYFSHVESYLATTHPPSDTDFFFRPTLYGFRQVVQHVSNHVAYEIN